MERFEVEVDNLKEAVLLMKVLADYDTFQYKNKIKSDYSNAGGVEILEDGKWVDWYDSETGEDDPIEYSGWEIL